MPMREPFMIKHEYTNADLTLQAEAGKSLLIRDIIVLNPAASYATITIDKDTVGYFRVAGNLGNHLGMGKGSTKHSHGITVAAADGALTEDHAVRDAFGVSNAHLAVFSDRAALTTEPNAIDFGSVSHGGFKTILGLLTDREIFRGYPVAEGQTFTISGVKQAGCLQLVIYAEFDAGDVLSTSPNGTKSDEYEFINYGRVGATITTSADTIYDTTQSPAQFPDFPFGKDVPAKYQIQLHGILASDIVDDRSGNDCMNSDYLKLVRERTTLFDSDKKGLFLKGIIGTTDAAAIVARGYSIIGNYSDIDQKPPFMLDPAIAFLAGEELGVYLTTTVGASYSASGLLVADTEIGLIERVIKI